MLDWYAQTSQGFKFSFFRFKGIQCSTLHQLHLLGLLVSRLRTYPPQFGWHTVKHMPKLKTKGRGCPKIKDADELIDGPRTFSEMPWGSQVDWADARLTSVIVYLRGGDRLKLPDKWKAVLPTHIHWNPAISEPTEHTWMRRSCIDQSFSIHRSVILALLRTRGIHTIQNRSQAFTTVQTRSGA